MSTPRRWHRWFVPVVFAVHAAVTLAATLAHEAWFDEADVWLLMRDGGLATLFRQTSNMGTPALWYLAVWPFASSGMPYLSQQLLNLAFEWTAMLLFLFLAPVPRWFKALFALSYYAAFEYAVLARPYALLMMLLFVIAANWRTRNEHPVRIAVAVLLLANVTVHGLMIAAIAGLVLLLDWIDSRQIARPRIIAALVLMSAGGVAALAQVWPRGAGQMLFLSQRVEVSTLTYVLSEAFFYDSRPGVGVWLAAIVMGTALVSLSRHPVPLFFFVGATAQLLFLFVFVWTGGARHAGLLLLLLIASLWIAEAYGPATGFRGAAHRVAVAACALGVAWGIGGAADAWRNEIRHPYSGSRDMAGYLRGHELDRVAIAAHPWGPTDSVLVYLPGKKFWFPSKRDYASHGSWGVADRPADITIEEAVQRSRTAFSGRRWLLLTAGELPPEARRGLRLRYHTEGPIWGRKDENYWLYEPPGDPVAGTGRSTSR